LKLYYLTGACSLAAGISLLEAGVKFEWVKVDRHSKKTADGLDHNEVNPKGYVPALRLDNGEVLTENVAVLLYIGDRNPAAKLAPPEGTMERYRLVEWLAFINSEIHKNFSPLFQQVPEDVKQFARKNLTNRLNYLERALGNQAFLMGEQFTVADAYLYVVLGWSAHVQVDLAQWPQLKRYVDRVGGRPHVIAAMRHEGLIKS